MPLHRWFGDQDDKSPVTGDGYAGICGGLGLKCPGLPDRPNRRAQDAISEIHIFSTNRYEWVLECDIKACFDEISHTGLMGRLRARIKDKRVCSLVKAFLKSGVFTELGDREESLTGTPQGGILSPLLANIALSALDDHFHQQWQQKMGTRWRKHSGPSAGRA